MVIEVVLDLDRSIAAKVLNIILVIVPLRLVIVGCHILGLPELVDVVPIFGTVRLKIHQFASILLTPIVPELLVSSCPLRSVY